MTTSKYLAAIHAVLAGIALAGPITNAFTYQGQLKRDGTPLDGTADMRFTLWDSASGGSVASAPLTQLAVPVVNGLFTVQLDFGAGVFDLSAKWIAVEIRHPAGGGAFVPLSTRQPISAVPYARTALNVPWAIEGNDIHTILAGNVGIGMDSPAAKLTVFGPGSTSPATGVLSLWSPGGTIGNIMTFDGNEINGWSHLHLNPDATTDILMVEGGGDVGIGTGFPAAKLHVVGGTDTAPTGGGFAVFGSTTSTNISIDNNEIMARNNGAVATLTLNANGGDIACGGSLDIGWEIITSGPSVAPKATCSPGKKILGGGCFSNTVDQIYNSWPRDGGTAWECYTGTGTQVTAYAICANVK